MIGNDLAVYTTNQTQDLVISERILNGEKELFALLLKPHNKALYFAVKSIVQNEADIESSLLASYAAALKRLYCFYGQCAFKVWILSVAIRETYRLAAEKADEQASRDETTARLIFTLYKEAGLSKQEIAACLQISLKDVKQSLRLSKKNHMTAEDSSYHHDHLIGKFMDELLSDPASIYGSYRDLKDLSPEMSDAETKAEAIAYFRQEHSENLSLCTNIRLGFLKGVEMQRIKNYTDWYWNNHLMAHFISEEKIIFPILGRTNPLVKKAVSEHKRLRRLFESKQEIHRMLNRIEEELEAHIRFEEKVLFKEIEQYAGKDGIETIESLHRGHQEETWSDPFWK